MNINFHRLHSDDFSLTDSQPKAKRGIINNLPRPQKPPPQDLPWDPARSFVLLLNSNSVAVFLIPRHKNGSGTFAQICKLEPEKQMPPRFVGRNSCCKTSLDSHFHRFQFSQNALFQLSWDRRHLRNSLRTSVVLAAFEK